MENYTPIAADPSRSFVDGFKLHVETFRHNGVTVKYFCPENYSPKDNGNWIGLWQGLDVPDNADPLGKANIDSASSLGRGSIEGIKIGINDIYTVGYFMAAEDKGGRTALAASFTIST